MSANFRNGYSDEPENGIEVEENAESEDDYKYKSTKTNEFKDDDVDDDDFQPRKTEAPTSPSTKKTPTKKIDLGAAAKFTGSSSNNSNNTTSASDDFADFSSFPSTAQAVQPQKSSNNLDDLLGSPLSEPLKPAGGNTSGNVDLFGDFSSPGEILFYLISTPNKINIDNIIVFQYFLYFLFN